jgi:hypothetical protein
VDLRRPRVFIAIGSVLLSAGLLSGVVNHEVIDGARFARHADAIRQDPNVAQQVGEALTRRVLQADPDLVAIRPLIETTAVTLAGSPAFSPIVRAAVASLHRAFTESVPVVLRVADVGAVLVGALRALAPRAADQLPEGLDVTLARVGSQSFASRTIQLAHLVSLLAWLLPLLALLCFGGAIWMSADRRRTAADVGWGVVGAGGLLLGAAVGVSIATSFADTDTLSGALITATWREFRGAIWWAAGGALTAGMLFSVAASRRPTFDAMTALKGGWTWLTRDSETLRGRLARAVIWVVFGAGFLFRPELVISVLAAVLGVTFVVHGASQLVLLVRDRLEVARERGTRSLLAGRWLRPVTGVFGVALLVSLFVVLSRPVETEVALKPRAVGSSAACNGHVELCDRPYDDVAFPATHNSMSAADAPGWFLPEQPTGLIGQLDDGIRVLLIDSWYGQTTHRPGVVATAPASRDQALAEADDTYGASVVQSALRLRDAAKLEPTGPVQPYLCHGLCELGSTAWEPAMEEVRAWLDAHPRNVVTFFIQDEVSPADTAAVFDEAGLLPYVHTQTPGEPWPTLGQMIDSGRRVVVLMEHRGGGSSYPWLLQGFDWVQDTPYDFASVSEFNCTRLRGAATSPLLLVNHWLNHFRSRVSDAAAVNAYDVLWRRVAECQRKRKMLPNFVAVNFYDRGDLFAVVDRLNGLG